MKRLPPLIAACAVAVLSGCTTTETPAPLAVTAVSTSMTAARELTDDEKKIIADSLLDNIREPEKADIGQLVGAWKR